MIAPADRALHGVLTGPPRPVRVLLHTSTAAYLGPGDDDPWAVLVDDGGLLVPDAIALPAGLGWRQVLAGHLHAGAPVRIGDGQLQCGPRTLTVQGELDLRVPVPGRPAAEVAGLAQRAIAALRAVLGNGPTAPRDGPGANAPAHHEVAQLPPAPPVPPGTAAGGRAAQVWPQLTHRWSSGLADPATVATDAPCLIGNGPGLTPSGDDILAAAILTHTVLGTPGTATAAAQVLKHSARRTTAASIVSLRAAAQARAIAPVRHLLQALLDGPNIGADVTAQAAQVLAVGHFSGGDLLRGIHDALLAVAHTSTTPHAFAPAPAAAAGRTAP